MISAQPPRRQQSGPYEWAALSRFKIPVRCRKMHEGIDGDQRHADFKPPGANVASVDQNPDNAMASTLSEIP
jgi:hypothetical protein